MSNKEKQLLDVLIDKGYLKYNADSHTGYPILFGGGKWNGMIRVLAEDNRKSVDKVEYHTLISETQILQFLNKKR
jgi:hypothetical protein